MDAFIQFMQSVTGRTLRVILGIILIALGVILMRPILWVGIVVVVIGLVPLVAALLGVCLIAPLFGYSLTGHKPVGPAHS